MSELAKDLLYFFINWVVPFVPSRKLRMLFYSIVTNNEISRNAFIAMGVRILDVRGVSIGSNSNVNFGCILDGRGAKLVIGENVDVAPQTNIWTLEHDPNSNTHAARARSVMIGDDVWLGNRVIVLPGSTIGCGAVIGAGSIVSGAYEVDSLYLGCKASKCKTLPHRNDYGIGPIRRFR